MYILAADNKEDTRQQINISEIVTQRSYNSYSAVQLKHLN